MGISGFLRDKLVQGAGVPVEKVFALRHSWDAMAEAPAIEDGGYYLFLGRLVEVKGVEMLLRAWETLEKRLGDKAPELWIGGEGPLEALVREASARGRKVRHLGLVEGNEKREAIRHCRAMLAPSLWWEPLGLVTYEAYDFAKPMLAAASGGLTETVVNGQTGFLHEQGNMDSLADSVLKIEAMSEMQRKTMGAAGRKWLLENAGVEEWKRRFSVIVQTAMA